MWDQCLNVTESPPPTTAVADTRIAHKQRRGGRHTPPHRRTHTHTQLRRDIGREHAQPPLVCCTAAADTRRSTHKACSHKRRENEACILPVVEVCGETVERGRRRRGQMHKKRKYKEKPERAKVGWDGPGTRTHTPQQTVNPCTLNALALSPAAQTKQSRRSLLALEREGNGADRRLHTGRAWAAGGRQTGARRGGRGRLRSTLGSSRGCGAGRGAGWVAAPR